MEQIEQPINIPNQQQQPSLPVEDVLPYNLQNIFSDKCSARIISPAYAGKNSELTAVLEYMFQALIFQNLGYNDIYLVLENIAVQEMRHLELLGKTLLKLGATPIYTAFPPIRDNFFNTRFVNYNTNPRTMLQNNIINEQRAINMYSNMLTRLTNQEVKNVIQSILKDEQEHILTFNRLLNSL